MHEEVSKSSRLESLEVLERVAGPVLEAASRGRLRAELPRRGWETRESNIHTSPLQALGRTLSGIGPWLALPAAGNDGESRLRQKMLDQARAALRHAIDPASPDFMFPQHTQERIVHGCYLAYALLTLKDELWAGLSPEERSRCLGYLQTHRGFRCNEGNWLLFAAILECAGWELADDHDPTPIEYAVQRHLEYYVGDGTYGDGTEFHWDYYNSYVIQPFFLEVLRICRDRGHPAGQHFDTARRRAQRYAEVLERMISPEGTFPVVGRSSVYRIAAFYHLGYMAWRGWLPESLRPGTVRAALTAVIGRMMSAPGTFDDAGWLQPGAVGHQPDMIDPYNYTGALYFCAMGFTHLGLPGDAPFWTEPAGRWTQQRVWAGEPVARDAYYREPSA